MSDPENANDLGWEILAREDGVWLCLAGGGMINLGPKEAVFAKWADMMGRGGFWGNPQRSHRSQVFTY